MNSFIEFLSFDVLISSVCTCMRVCLCACACMHVSFIGSVCAHAFVCFTMLCMIMFINVFVCLYTIDSYVGICVLHFFI